MALAVWQDRAVELLWSCSLTPGLTWCNAPSTPPKLGAGEALLETLPVGNTLWVEGCFHPGITSPGGCWFRAAPSSSPNVRAVQIPAVSPVCECGLLVEVVCGLCLGFGGRFLHA